jgi:hypothetical protein
MNNSLTKHRPSLTLEQLKHIAYLAKQDVYNADSLNLLSTLVPFIAKIEVGASKGAYSTKPKQSIEDKLGMNTAPMYCITVGKHITAVTKEEYWKWCYAKYSEDIDTCTLPELQAAKEHMYLHDLMSPEEAKQFELSNQGDN